MKKKKLFIVLVIFFILVLTQITAYADTGPKPSVVIDFEGLKQENCYVTLLSKSDSTGPHSVYDGHSNHARYNKDDKDSEVWEKFVSYKDKDGFYFLQYFNKLDDNSVFKWGYYPPEEFKILVYFRDYNSFAVSDEIYKRYAFDSYYKVNAANLNAKPVVNGSIIRAVKNYNYTNEMISLSARSFITILIELIIALAFGFRAKKQLVIIGITNITTQIILNSLLNIINYKQGLNMYIISYFCLELLVFIIEAAIYYFALNKYETRPLVPKYVPVLYAFAANVVSFIAGFGIAYILPGIF